MDTLLDRALTLLKGQIGVARAVGAWAQKACEQALASDAESRPAPSTVSEHAEAATPPTPPESFQQPTSAEDESPGASLGASVDRAAAAHSAGDLGISGYDQLAASQIVARLDALSPQQRAAIAEHERAHRRRRTVLHRLAQLDSD